MVERANNTQSSSASSGADGHGCPDGTRPPDLEVDLSAAAHPSRSARKEMRRFLATRSIALVDDAGVAVTEVVRRAHRTHSGSVCLRAWFDSHTHCLRVEVTDGSGRAGAGNDADGSLNVLTSLAVSWGTEAVEDGESVWFEMQPRGLHDRRGRPV